MLRKRIIPCLDVKDGRVVKGTNFVDLVDEGDPVQLAERYATEGADEICFLDIGATHEGRGSMLKTIRETAQNVFIPMTVGGGIRSVTDMVDVLRSGADKVAINSAAVHSPRLIQDGAQRFGSQCIVVAIDAKRVGTSWRIFTHGGRVDTGLCALAWSTKAARLGAGELLVTSMDRDGTYDGYDVDLLAAIRQRVSIPIIASGGAGEPHHLVAAVHEGHADAVLAASIFHRSEHSIESVKETMFHAGIPVRRIAS